MQMRKLMQNSGYVFLSFLPLFLFAKDKRRLEKEKLSFWKSIRSIRDGKEIRFKKQNKFLNLSAKKRRYNSQMILIGINRNCPS